MHQLLGGMGSQLLFNDRKQAPLKQKLNMVDNNQEQNQGKLILLVDSKCKLCNKSVAWIIKNSQANKFIFISLYDEESKPYLKKFNMPADYKDSLVLIKKNKVYIKSSAMLHITKELNGAIPVLFGFIIIPRLFRDKVYDIIANHRHKLA